MVRILVSEVLPGLEDSPEALPYLGLMEILRTEVDILVDILLALAEHMDPVGNLQAEVELGLARCNLDMEADLDAAEIAEVPLVHKKVVIAELEDVAGIAMAVVVEMYRHMDYVVEYIPVKSIKHTIPLELAMGMFRILEMYMNRIQILIPEPFILEFQV